MLGHEFGMLAQAVAGALDLNDDGVVQQSVEQGRGDDGIAEHLALFGEAAVGGEDHGAAFVSSVDQREEQVAAAGHDRQVADLVHDQQRRPAQEADALLQASFALGAGELGQEIRQGVRVRRYARLSPLPPRALWLRSRRARHGRTSGTSPDNPSASPPPPGSASRSRRW